MIKLAWDARERRADIRRSPTTIRVNAPETIAMFRALSRFTCGADVAVSITGAAAGVLAAVSGGDAGGSDSFCATTTGAGVAAGFD